MSKYRKYQRRRLVQPSAFGPQTTVSVEEPSIEEIHTAMELGALRLPGGRKVQLPVKIDEKTIARVAAAHAQRVGGWVNTNLTIGGGVSVRSL